MSPESGATPQPVLRHLRHFFRRLNVNLVFIFMMTPSTKSPSYNSMQMTSNVEEEVADITVLNRVVFAV